MKKKPIARAIPGPPPMPLVGWYGNLLRLINDPFNYMTKIRRTYGDIVALAQGGNKPLLRRSNDKVNTLFVFGPKYAHQVLSDTKTFQSGPFVGSIYPTGKISQRKEALQRLGTGGLFGANDHKHRQQRRLLMPLFHRKYIKAYRDDMVAITKQVLDNWQVKQSLNIWHEMKHLTWLIAGKTLFDLDFRQDTENIGAMMQEWTKLIASFGVIMMPVDLPGLPYRRFLDLCVHLDEKMRALIARKRANRADNGNILSMLIQAHDEEGYYLTENELIEHANFLFIAGHETTTNALTWTLFLLAQHPQVMAELLNELEAELHGDAPTVDQLHQLPLLERVIKESMRLLPPVPTSTRIVVETTQLGPYQFPKGTEIVLSHYHTHHDPNIYPEPNKFRPDRWLTIKPSAYEYLPFSAGRRMCIGASFAIMEIQIVLAMLLQRYRLQLAPNARIDPLIGLSLGPKNGLPMIVHQQDGQVEQSKSRVRGHIHEIVDLGV